MDWRDAEVAFDDPVIEWTTLPQIFEASASRNASRVAQQYKGGIYQRSSVAEGVVPAALDGDCAGLTYDKMRGIAHRLAARFRDLDIESGGRVGVLSHTRIEWAQTDFTVLAAGGVIITVYTSSSKRQAQYSLSDPGAGAVVVENEALLRCVLAVENELDLQFIVVVDEYDGHDDREGVLTLGKLYRRGEEAHDGTAYESWLDEHDPENLASPIYTPGMTGQPKSTRLTHWNFRSNVNKSYRRFGPRPDRGDTPVTGPGAVTLSFPPLAHVFEHVAGHFMMFMAGTAVAYTESPDTLRKDFQLIRPMVGTNVPHVYKKLYDAIRAQASGSPTKKRVSEWAIGVGQMYHTTDASGYLLTAEHCLADRLVFGWARGALDGNLDFFTSGGESLSTELCALYHAMDLPIYEGYGLAEISSVISADLPEAPEIGTIGCPFRNVETKLDTTVVDDQLGEADGGVGELLVRGPSVTEGYRSDPEETEAAFVEDDEGRRWFRTGDVVERRPDSYIAFRECVKQTLVLPAGKNVAPGPIEDAFVSSPVVEQCMALNDGRRFVSALIIPSFDGLRKWATKEGIDLPDDPKAVCHDDRVYGRIETEVDAASESFESYERIKQFRIVPEEFSEGGDLMMPAVKRKHRNTLNRYADEVSFICNEDHRTEERRSHERDATQ